MGRGLVGLSRGLPPRRWKREALSFNQPALRFGFLISFFFFFLCKTLPDLISLESAE